MILPEVPKLFLYYSKALDYVIAPKVVCSQPRILPVKKNANRVSQSLGVPIKIGDETGKKELDSLYYYIQTNFGDKDKDKHVKRVDHTMLKYITDGTLILEFKKNILLKGKNKSDKYKLWNLYDIIMIDEAHEHKKNMDLLLTILKISVNFNNSLKIVILSATMEDEYRYRRFFRDINDNRKYPLNESIKQYKLDRINVDRRFHIAIDEKTNYDIKEIYDEKKTELEIILEILRTTSDGEILVFKPGEKDIENLIKELTPIIPNDIKIVSLYSKMPKDEKIFVENIPKSLENTIWKRAIIVATNIAEASITISSLKFVIDTGNQKVSIYDYKKQGSNLVIKPISESSRIQRKGRVGRTSSGTVYYLYNKNAFENNKTMYELSIDDLSLIIINYLKHNNIESLLINIDVNNPKNILNYDNLENNYPNNLHEIIAKQYFNDEQYYDYFGNNESYDYNNYLFHNIYYESGFSYDTLTDKYGIFYLIHPEELNIKRNINGDITGVISSTREIKFEKTNKYKGIIKSKKIKSFWKTLYGYLYIRDDTHDKYIKTTFGNTLLELLEKNKSENHGLFRMLIFGLSMNYRDIIKLYVMYEINKTIDIIQILDKNKPVNINSIFKLFNLNSHSNSELVLKIILKFHEFVKSLDIETNYDNKYIRLLQLQNDKLSIDDYKSLLGSKEHYTEKIKKYILETENNESKQIDEIMKTLEKHQSDDINMNEYKIKQWCELHNLNHEILINYLKEYSKFNIKLYKEIDDTYINLINKLSESFTKLSSRKINKLELALLLGFPFNVVRNIGSMNYLSVYNPILTNTYQINLKIYDMNNYLLYLKLDIEKNQISCLHKISPKLITILSNIYSKKHFDKLKIDESSISKFILFKTKQFKIPSATITNVVTNYTRTLNKINSECSKYADDVEIIKFINSIKNQ
jgi:hypothetical protein